MFTVVPIPAEIIIARFSFFDLRNLKTKYDNIPIKNLGKTDTKGFKNTKYIGDTGAVKFCIIEDIPNIKPVQPPTKGPKDKAPIITGMNLHYGRGAYEIE